MKNQAWKGREKHLLATLSSNRHLIRTMWSIVLMWKNIKRNSFKYWKILIGTARVELHEHADSSNELSLVRETGSPPFINYTALGKKDHRTYSMWGTFEGHKGNVETGKTKKKKTLVEILGCPIASPPANNRGGRKKKNKSVVFRAATAAIALSDRLKASPIQQEHNSSERISSCVASE